MFFKKKGKRKEAEENETYIEQVSNEDSIKIDKSDEEKEAEQFEMDTEDDEIIDFGEQEQVEKSSEDREENIKSEEENRLVLGESNENMEADEADTEASNNDNEAATNEAEEQKEMVLYVISDKDTNDLLTFMRECGLVVDRIFETIEDLKNALLFLDIPCRIVVIDSGSSKFSSISMRKELIDLLGIADEQNKISIYYTDNSIKSDAVSTLGKKHKDIDWAVYENTTSIIATLMTNGERYVYDYEDNIEMLDLQCLLDSKGTHTNVEKDKAFKSELDMYSLQNSIDNENDEQIERFETVY